MPTQWDTSHGYPYQPLPGATAQQETGLPNAATNTYNTPALFGVPAVPVIGWGNIMTGNAFTNGQVGTGYTSRILYKTVIACTDIRLVLAAWGSTSAGDIVPPNDLYYKCAIEYNSTFYPVTFNGTRKPTINAYGTMLSDPVALEMAKGDTFAVRTWYDTPAAGSYWANTPTMGPPVYGCPVGGTLAGYGYSAAGDVVDATSVATTVNASPWPGAMTIIGTPLGGVPKSLVGVGDSITFGTGESSPFQNGNGGYLTRAVNDTMPHFKVAVSGMRAGSYFTKSVGTRANSYLSLGTHASVMFGTNDIFLDGRTLAQMQSYLTYVWTILANRGLKVNACTIVPQTTSTDSWVTTGNQTTKSGETVRTAVNDWIRAGAPLTGPTGAIITMGTTGHPLWGYYESADAVESSRNSGIWKASGSAYTADGTHPSTLGHTAIAAIMDLTRLP